MAKYFNYFPSTYYSLNETNVNNLDIVTNIISRYAFGSSIKENVNAFYEYEVKDSDTPEIIASKFYGSPERHWIVLMFNDIVDPQYDWPLSYDNFIEYVDKKYSASEYANNTTSGAGVAWAQNINNIHSYYKVSSRGSVYNTSDKKTITEKIQIDKNTYDNLQEITNQYTLQNGSNISETITKEKQTYYDYEYNLNESKRKIKLLKQEFAEQVFREFKEVIAL
jgi:hypothetical protein